MKPACQFPVPFLKLLFVYHTVDTVSSHYSDRKYRAKGRFLLYNSHVNRGTQILQGVVVSFLCRCTP